MSKWSEYVNDRIAERRTRGYSRIFGTPEPDSPSSEQNIIDRLFPNRENNNTEGDNK